MPTFLDESGSTSYHRDSQPYFRLCAVWVPADRADELRAALARVRTELSLPRGFEFKYHKSQHRSDRLRAFYTAALAANVRFVSVCMDKRRDPWVGREPLDFFYDATMHVACSLRAVYCAEEVAAGKLRRDPVIVDNNSDGTFLACVRHAFLGLHSPLRPGVPLAQPPKFSDSRSSELLQLPDMIGGAVGDLLDGDPTWYNLLAPAGVQGTWLRRPGVIFWE